MAAVFTRTRSLERHHVTAWMCRVVRSTARWVLDFLDARHWPLTLSPTALALIEILFRLTASQRATYVSSVIHERFAQEAHPVVLTYPFFATPGKLADRSGISIETMSVKERQLQGAP